MRDSSKQKIAGACYKEIFGNDPPESYYSGGSTVTAYILRDIAERFELPTNEDKVNTAKEICKHLKVSWHPSFCSEDEPSGGGGTLTKEFYEDLHKHLKKL